MSDLNETFFTAVGCMDGRVQAPIAKYGGDKFQAKYPDTITEPGLAGLLANNPSEELLENIKKKILISSEKHRSKGIVVHGHQECTGNPIDDELHKQQVLKAAHKIREMARNLEVKPVFVVRVGDHWVVEEL